MHLMASPGIDFDEEYHFCIAVHSFLWRLQSLFWHAYGTKSVRAELSEQAAPHVVAVAKEFASTTSSRRTRLYAKAASAALLEVVVGKRGDVWPYSEKDIACAFRG